jgi:NADH:ubiquinone oxidoreductase subunit 3 (subunit A)
MTETPPYLFLAVFLGIAIAFPLIPIAAAHLWSRWFTPAKPGVEKNAAYECGIEATGTARIQFKSQYYLYGIVFLIFDVEAAFLIPIAVAFLDLSIGAVIATFIFMLLLVEGLAWAWAKGVLKWD